MSKRAINKKYSFEEYLEVRAKLLKNQHTFEVGKLTCCYDKSKKTTVVCCRQGLTIFFKNKGE